MTRKIPIRQCTGCAEHKPKGELIRIVKTPEDKIIIDATGKASGRGAYICKNSECLAAAVKKKRIDSVLGVTVQKEIYDTLLKELSGIE